MAPTSSSFDIVLVTASTLPAPDVDTEVIADKLRARGLKVKISQWDDPNEDWTVSTSSTFLIRSPWNYVDKMPSFLGWLEHFQESGPLDESEASPEGRVSRRPILINSPALIRWNITKLYLEQLQLKGISIIPTVILKHDLESQQLPSAIAEAIQGLSSLHSLAGASTSNATSAAANTGKAGDLVIVKPTVGCGASRLNIFDRADIHGIGRHLSGLFGLGMDALLQLFIEEVRTEGELSMVYFNGKLSHAVKKLPKAGDFRVNREFGATSHIHYPTRTEIEFGDKVLRTVNQIAGTTPVYARVDTLQSDSYGCVLMELEIFEPDLYFRTAPAHCLDAYIDAVSSSIVEGSVGE